MIDGILCINIPSKISPMLSPGSNTSKENIVKKQINRIDRILGAQYIIPSDLVIF